MDLRKRLASKPLEPEKETDCRHIWREFRVGVRELEWPVRQCQKCEQRQVFSADGWIDDDWTRWLFEVQEIEA